MQKKKGKSFKQVKRKPFAKKSFGQNFLIDENYINRIVSAVNPQPHETVIEIGPGRGAISEKLLSLGVNLIAVELDDDMIEVLADKFKYEENFKLIQSDVLKVDFREITGFKDSEHPLKLVGNLPYYISTAILQRLIEQRETVSEMTLMLQREVVDRLIAQPGNSERGYLTVLIEAFYKVEKLFDVPPSAFRPSPKIWSSVVKLIPTVTDNFNEKIFKNLVSVGFQQKRKTILNNFKNLDSELLSKLEPTGGLEQYLKSVGIDSGRRAESLNLEEWKSLVNKLETIEY